MACALLAPSAHALSFYSVGMLLQHEWMHECNDEYRQPSYHVLLPSRAETKSDLHQRNSILYGD